MVIEIILMHNINLKTVIMEIGEIKEINKKGLSFKVERIDESILVPETGELKNIGVVISDVPSNKFGITKGTKIGLSN